LKSPPKESPKEKGSSGSYEDDFEKDENDGDVMKDFNDF
jgi:hypothetical protein